MSPRTGRPKSDNPKNVDLRLRITQGTARDLAECAAYFKVSRTAVIEKGIKLVKAEIKK